MVQRMFRDRRRRGGSHFLCRYSASSALDSAQCRAGRTSTIQLGSEKRSAECSVADQTGFIKHFSSWISLYKTFLQMQPRSAFVSDSRRLTFGIIGVPLRDEAERSQKTERRRRHLRVNNSIIHEIMVFVKRFFFPAENL